MANQLGSDLDVEKTFAAPSSPTVASPWSTGRYKGHASGAATATEANKSMTPKSLAIENAKFECRKNTIYHEDRSRFFGAIEKGLKFLSLLFGSGFFVALAAEVPTAYKCFGGVLATVSLANAVFEYGNKYRQHETTRKKFAERSSALAKPDVDISDVQHSIEMLYVDELPTYHWVLAFAFNRTIDELGRNPVEKIALTKLEIRLRHFWPATGSELAETVERKHSMA